MSKPASDPRTLLPRLYEADPNSGCWLWTGATMAMGGYGKATHQGRSIQAHRLSYESYVGPIPPGLVLAHACDTPLCINPAHLRAGTHADNMADRNSRGRARGPKGQPMHSGKLTPENRAFIREHYKRGDLAFGSSALAKRFGVTRRAILWTMGLAK